MNKKQFDKAIAMSKLAKMTNKYKTSVVGVSVKDQQITSLTSINENYTITIGVNESINDAADSVITVKTDDINKLSNINGYDVSVDTHYTDVDNKVKFLCESTNVTLKISDVDYSYINDKRKYSTLTDMFITYDTSGFTNALKYVGKFASTDNTRSIFTGLQFNREGLSDYIHIVGVDGFRILDIQHKCQVTDFKSFVLPMPTIKLLLKAIDKDVINIEFKATDSKCIHIHISYKDNTYVSIVSDVLEGEFLRYEQIFTTESKVSAIIKPDTMYQELKEIHAVMKDAKHSPTKLYLKNDKLTLLSMDDSIKIEKNIDVTNSSGDIDKLAFNQSYMMDALEVFKQFKESEIQFNYNSEYTPIILNNADSLIRALILPIRVNK